jgi:hypothetical protein
MKHVTARLIPALSLCLTLSAVMESPAAQGAIRIQERAELELTGDSAPETVIVSAAGADWQSLDVRVEIRSGVGGTLYQKEWRSLAYFTRVPISPGDSPERVVRGALSAIVGDQKALHADMVKRGHPIHSESEMRDAIEWDLVEKAFPGLSEGAGTPGAYARRVRDARRMLSQDHVDALFLELRDQPKFMYFSGNETHTGIAWSARERRFVRIYLCC